MQNLQFLGFLSYLYSLFIIVRIFFQSLGAYLFNLLMGSAPTCIPITFTFFLYFFIPYKIPFYVRFDSKFRPILGANSKSISSFTNSFTLSSFENQDKFWNFFPKANWFLHKACKSSKIPRKWIHNNRVMSTPKGNRSILITTTEREIFFHTFKGLFSIISP